MGAHDAAEPVRRAFAAQDQPRHKSTAIPTPRVLVPGRRKRSATPAVHGAHEFLLARGSHSSTFAEERRPGARKNEPCVATGHKVCPQREDAIRAAQGGVAKERSHRGYAAGGCSSSTGH